MNFCPNTSLPEAKALIEKLGLLGFYKEYIRNGYNIPTNRITVDNKEILYQNQTNSTEGIDNTAFSDSKDDEVFNDISDIIQFNNIFNFEDIKINNTEYKDDSNQIIC